MKLNKYYQKRLIYSHGLGVTRKYGLLTLGNKASRVSWYVLALLALASGLILLYLPEVVVGGVK